MKSQTPLYTKGSRFKHGEKIIKQQNDQIAKLSKSLHDTLLIVLADHGHIKTKTLYLKDYPDILDLMTHKTSVDQRAAVFKIKPGKKQEFRRRFNKHFGDFYTLYSAKEVRDSKLFGDSPENILFESMLGDFLAIAKTDVAITAPGDHYHVSPHAGYTDDEILIPFIAKFLP